MGLPGSYGQSFANRRPTHHILLRYHGSSLRAERTRSVSLRPGPGDRAPGPRRKLPAQGASGLVAVARREKGTCTVACMWRRRLEGVNKLQCLHRLPRIFQEFIVAFGLQDRSARHRYFPYGPAGLRARVPGLGPGARAPGARGPVKSDPIVSGLSGPIAGYSSASPGWSIPSPRAGAHAAIGGVGSRGSPQKLDRHLC